MSKSHFTVLVILFYTIGNGSVSATYQAVVNSTIPLGCEASDLVITVTHPNSSIYPTLLVVSHQYNHRAVIMYNKVNDTWQKGSGLNNNLFEGFVSVQALSERSLEISFSKLTEKHHGWYLFELKPRGKADDLAKGIYRIGPISDIDLNPKAYILSDLQSFSIDDHTSTSITEDTSVLIETNFFLTASIAMDFSDVTLTCNSTSRCMSRLADLAPFKHVGKVSFSVEVHYDAECVRNPYLFGPVEIEFDNVTSSSQVKFVATIIVLVILVVALLVVVVVLIVLYKKKSTTDEHTSRNDKSGTGLAPPPTADEFSEKLEAWRQRDMQNPNQPVQPEMAFPRGAVVDTNMDNSIVINADGARDGNEEEAQKAEGADSSERDKTPETRVLDSKNASTNDSDEEPTETSQMLEPESEDSSETTENEFHV